MNYKYYIVALAGGLIYLIYQVIIYLHTKVPYVVTPRKHLVKLFQHLTINKNTVVYDLGSGKGDFLFALEKLQPRKLVGFELSPLHVWYSRLKAKLTGSRIQFLRQDFFQADFSQADIIYIFLVKSVIDKLWSKIKAEAKPGAWVIILSESMADAKPIKIINTNPQNPKSKYYIYKI